MEMREIEGKMARQLYKAATEGNVEFLRTEDGESRANEEEYFLGRTPLMKNNIIHIAAESGHKYFIQEALRLYPALLCQENSKGDTALHVAARSGHYPVVALLVNCYRSPHHSQQGQAIAADAASTSTSVIRDMEEGTVGEGEQLLRPLWRIKNMDGCTALHEALRNRHEWVALHLLNQDHNLACDVNKDQESPLYLAAENGFFRVMREILRSGVQYRMDGPNGQNPLHVVASLGCARLLLEKCPDIVNLADDFGQTALHYAAVRGKEQSVRELLEKDPQTAYWPDKEGLSPLLLAARSANVPAVKAILSILPDSIELVERRTDRNALHLAVLSSFSVRVRRLLKIPEMQQLINKPDNEGNTPIHLAVERHQFLMVSELLATKCVDLKAKNKKGLTALDICESKWELSNQQRRIWVRLVRRKASRGRQRASELKIPPRMKTVYRHPKADLKKMASTMSVVAALMTTLTFAAAFTIPGGYNNNSPHMGLAVLGKKVAFQIFVLSDTFAVCCSMVVVFLLISAVVGDPNYLYWTIIHSSNLLYFGLYATLVAFMSGLYAVLSEEALWLAIVICIMSSGVPFLLRLLRISASGSYVPTLFLWRDEMKQHITTSAEGNIVAPEA